MTNLEKLNNIFCDVFSVGVDQLNDEFDNTTVEGWDSVHQLSLTSTIEDEFDIMLDAEDILECNSYDKVKAILAKYDIKL